MNSVVNSESWDACYNKIIDYSSPNHLGSDFYSKKTFIVLPSSSCIPNIKKKILNRSLLTLPQFLTFNYIEDLLLFNSKQKKIERQKNTTKSKYIIKYIFFSHKYIYLPICL